VLADERLGDGPEEASGVDAEEISHDEELVSAEADLTQNPPGQGLVRDSEDCGDIGLRPALLY
jgi:hypothetical protein